MKILYFENEKKEYQFLYEGISSRHDVYPKPADFANCITLCLDFLAHTRKFTGELSRYIENIGPDIIIIDVALVSRLQIAKNDFTGGELRKKFLYKAFPSIPVIFITGHHSSDLTPYFKTGDHFIPKFSHGIYPHPSIIPEILQVIEDIKIDRYA